MNGPCRKDEEMSNSTISSVCTRSSKVSEGNNAIAGNNARFSEKVLVREIFARWCP